MKACRGCGDSVSLLRVHGLIALAIEGFVVAFDIGRQRNVAKPVERFVKTCL